MASDGFQQEHHRGDPVSRHDFFNLRPELLKDAAGDLPDHHTASGAMELLDRLGRIDVAQWPDGEFLTVGLSGSMANLIVENWNEPTTLRSRRSDLNGVFKFTCKRLKLGWWLIPQFEAVRNPDLKGDPKRRIYRLVWRCPRKTRRQKPPRRDPSSTSLDASHLLPSELPANVLGAETAGSGGPTARGKVLKEDEPGQAGTRPATTLAHIQQGAWEISREHLRCVFDASDFLHGLAEKGVIAPDRLYRTVRQKGGAVAGKALADHFAFLWPWFSPESFRALLDCCDEREDDAVLREIADAMAELFGRDPTAIRDFLGEAVRGVPSRRAVAAVLVQKTLKNKTFQTHFAFFMKFAVKAAVENFDDTDKMLLLRDCFRENYGYVISTMLDRRKMTLAKPLQRWILRKLEDAGRNQWDQAIGAQGNNNRFFVLDGGIRQRDLLYEYYPYIVACHNEDWRSLSLSPGSPFRRLTVAMLSYRANSVIGYAAAMATARVLAHDDRHLESLSDELITQGSQSAIYCLQSLLATLGRLNRKSCGRIMDVLSEKLVPLLVPQGIDDGLVGFLVLATSDMGRLWPKAVQTLESVVSSIEEQRGDQGLAAYARIVRLVCFHPEIELGTRLTEHLLDRQDVWTCGGRRELLVQVCAAMYARAPRVLTELLTRHGAEQTMLSEVREKVDHELFRDRDERSYQLAWTRLFIGSLTTHPSVRYYVLKVLVAGLIQSNSVPEFACEFRRFIVEGMRAFLNEDGPLPRNLHFSPEEALVATESQRRDGDGEVWPGATDRDSHYR